MSLRVLVLPESLETAHAGKGEDYEAQVFKRGSRQWFAPPGYLTHSAPPEAAPREAVYSVRVSKMPLRQHSR